MLVLSCLVPLSASIFLFVYNFIKRISAAIGAIIQIYSSFDVPLASRLYAFKTLRLYDFTTQNKFPSLHKMQIAVTKMFAIASGINICQPKRINWS